MGKFWDDIVPNELKEPVEKYITKPFASLTDKLIPNELRWMAPYAAGIGTLMLPPGMSPLLRGLIASGFNTAGQFAADESATGELSDLNALSQALSFGLGSLGSDSWTKGGPSGEGIRGGIEKGIPYKDTMTDTVVRDGPGFMQGTENVLREGIGSASDFVQGTRSTLADIGKNPGDLFKREIPGREGMFGLGNKQFPVLQDAAIALTPTAVQGTGDVAFETAIDLKNQFDLDQAREMEEAGLGLDQIQSARAAAIRAGLEDNNYSEEEIEVIFDRLGLTDWLDVAAQAPYEEAANGGIIGLRGGGMLKPKRGLVNEPGGYAGYDVYGWWDPRNLPTREQQEQWQRERLEREKRAQEEFVDEDVWSIQDIFERDTPLTEGIFGLSEGFTLSPITLLRRYLAEKELREKGDTSDEGFNFKNGGMPQMEMDYRGGGFIPVGSKERADDVPARLSKNEFVMTADAVRAAGGGSVNKGAQRMYDVMNKLEARA